MSYSVLESEWWSLAVPPEWWAETEEESILVGDHDEVGCIEISTLFKEEGEFDTESVTRIASDEAEAGIQWDRVSLGDFTGVRGRYDADGAAIREWYVARGKMLLYITYSCDDDNRGMDDAAVDEILDTLTVNAQA